MSRRYGSAQRKAASICDAAIDAIGPTAPRLRIVAEVERRLACAGLPSPSHASLTARIAYRRGLADWEPGGGARLVVDQVRLHVPTTVDGAAIDPVLSLAIIDPHRLIAGHLLRCGKTSAGAHAEAMLHRLPTTRHAPAIVTRLPNVLSDDWRRLRRLLADAGVPLATPTAASRPGREIATLLGRMLGGLPIGSARRHASVRMDTPVPIDELEAIVDAAVARHNRSIGRRIPPFNLARFATTDLLDQPVQNHGNDSIISNDTI